MNEAVSDIIVARSREADRLSTMLVWSIAAHIVGTALVLLMPAPRIEPPPQVMMISLGGAPGPRTGGLTQVGGRAVQAPQPDEPVRRAEAPPAPKPPPMALPDPTSKPVTAPKEAPREATGKTPSTGARPQDGSTRAETQVRGQGFGLSSGGGGGSGIRLDSNFCCPEYILEMRDRIRENWRNEGIPGLTTYKFVVQRDGSITNIQLEKSSGLGPLDFNAQRALLLTRRLPPLPDAYTNPTLTVHLDFDTSSQ